uniref:Uncharacterized protein n=1 Tax=Mucochytrium quahogii TaxID=96639 RepID=A0A7S2WE64_9STRA|mmetsp:Transcript_44464/g.71276  ORF Transcript_44464/g.71276 Transcript_44464/m.71276 type:complete len:415 (+) Transcript_44464:218-1462(+)
MKQGDFPQRRSGGRYQQTPSLASMLSQFAKIGPFALQQTDSKHGKAKQVDQDRLFSSWNHGARSGAYPLTAKKLPLEDYERSHQLVNALCSSQKKKARPATSGHVYNMKRDPRHQGPSRLHKSNLGFQHTELGTRKLRTARIKANGKPEKRVLKKVSKKFKKGKKKVTAKKLAAIKIQKWYRQRRVSFNMGEEPEETSRVLFCGSTSSRNKSNGPPPLRPSSCPVRARNGELKNLKHGLSRQDSDPQSFLPQGQIEAGILGSFERQRTNKNKFKLHSRNNPQKLSQLCSQTQASRRISWPDKSHMDSALCSVTTFRSTDAPIAISRERNLGTMHTSGTAQPEKSILSARTVPAVYQLAGQDLSFKRFGRPSTEGPDDDGDFLPSSVVGRNTSFNSGPWRTVRDAQMQFFRVYSS